MLSLERAGNSKQKKKGTKNKKHIYQKRNIGVVGKTEISVIVYVQLIIMYY